MRAPISFSRNPKRWRPARTPTGLTEAGYGNRRVIGQVDIGFDEFEFLVDGGFGNESIAIPSTANPCTISGSFPCNGNPANPCYCVSTGGAALHRLIMARAGSGHILPTVTLRDKTVNCPTGTYSIHPGALLPPTISGSNVFWFALPFTTTSGLTPTLHTTYIPPDSTSLIPHEFMILNRTSANVAKFRLFQAKIGTTWSNLQASFD
jgi:hypothetical protein